ncbi:SRPBCC family protein [Taibaiella koreensis]|uniref:SRPBCC family protein n=1 Tax=Taibaiella koreensis TaxID=1268548 RepID=UPI000E59D273|nr:SRPBCC domain-containing protein [Taibaiella koreensis]
MPPAPIIEKDILIKATPQQVWTLLTEPVHMLQWMGDPEMALEIDTNWQVGEPFIIRGRHHIRFENKGILLVYEPFRRLQYSQLSSLSRLPDLPGNHTLFDFVLHSQEEGTLLTLRLSHFPTETIEKHLAFYWHTTLHKIRKAAESLTQALM